MSEDHLADAFSEGYSAYENYKRKSDNPYPQMSDERAAWNRGYNQAAEDNEL